MSEASGVSVPAALVQHLSRLPLETLLAGREQTVLTLEHSNTIGEALRVRPARSNSLCNREQIARISAGAANSLPTLPLFPYRRVPCCCP